MSYSAIHKEIASSLAMTLLWC